ncbi:hypothetical protein MM326_15100 [Alkalihalobacillus sp. LMS6]|nr:hypothetical protein [Alkalihalobacillus sp. LMS6]UTR05423.1 hypothetical protein MM326_15100 [Alkalihalobacillus sp. LMS6]
MKTVKEIYEENEKLKDQLEEKEIKISILSDELKEALEQLEVALEKR